MSPEKKTKNLKTQPSGEGIFCLNDSKKQTIFACAADGLDTASVETLIEKYVPESVLRSGKSFDVETLRANDSIKLFARTIRERNPLYNVSLGGEILHPYLKMTSGDFPRLLATRKIADDGADYYGAFLPATGVRFWLEFINRTFRLRICEIPIDGHFPLPCTQFYVKRCVAPCVKSLCDRKTYLELVELVRLFLGDEREKFASLLSQKIGAAAERLEFEEAGVWRDILQKTTEIWDKKEWRLWLADAVDTFEVEEREQKIFVYTVTQRGRKTLGKKVFVFENADGARNVKQVLSDVVWQFYEFHAPQEIRLPFDFSNRKLLSRAFKARERREVKFTIINQGNERKTSIQALKRAKFDFDFRQIKPPVLTEDVLKEFETLFGLARPPRRIEAFDVAHISGTDFTAAKTVWEDGEFVSGENEFWLLDEPSELDSLRKAVGERFSSDPDTFPGVLLIDGGKSQLRAVLKAVPPVENRRFVVVGAVKPPGRHGEISHFILEGGENVRYAGESEAMRVLMRLRDEAHELANKIHRQRRETSHFYELAKILPSVSEGERRWLLQKFGSLKSLSGARREDLEKLLEAEKVEVILKDLGANRGVSTSEVKPVIVPLRFDDPNGEAKDLQPLNYTKI